MFSINTRKKNHENFNTLSIYCLIYIIIIKHYKSTFITNTIHNFVCIYSNGLNFRYKYTLIFQQSQFNYTEKSNAFGDEKKIKIKMLMRKLKARKTIEVSQNQVSFPQN